MQLERNVIHQPSNRIYPHEVPPSSYNFASSTQLHHTQYLPPSAPNVYTIASPTAQPPLQLAAAPPRVQYISPDAINYPVASKSSAGSCEAWKVVLSVALVVVLVGGAIAVAVIVVTNNNNNGDDNNSSGTNVSCASNQFYCPEGSPVGNCIILSWRCDNSNDCYDGSDERDCATTINPDTCDGFYCTTGSYYTSPCIYSTWECDGINDCLNGQDEAGCETVCPTGSISCGEQCISALNVCDRLQQCADATDESSCTAYCSGRFDCPYGNRFGTYCISYSRKCDGTADCSDGSDEVDCPVTACPDGTFTCDSSLCISSDKLCDRVSNCVDITDEVNCDTYCPGRFDCSNGNVYGSFCIHTSWVCDGDNDCSDAADEQNCADLTCNTNQFKCEEGSIYGICIPLSWKCDNINDCSSGSDESGCTDITDPIGSDMFQCPNHSAVIEKTRVCDGVEDCTGGRDEDDCLISSDGGVSDIRIFSVETLSHHNICADNWDSTKNTAACIALGFKGSSSFTTDIQSTEHGINCSGPIFDLNTFVQKSPVACTNQQIVRLTCSKIDVTCGKKPLISGSKIVGGQDATISEYPWQISLQVRSYLWWSHSCGGTVVGNKWVVTAAHCVNHIQNTDYESYRIFAGETRLSETGVANTFYSISKIVYHPLYSTSTYFMDVAVIKISEEFVFSDNIDPACLPVSRQTFTDYTTASLSGWGDLAEGGPSTDILQGLQLPLTNTYTCRTDFPNYAQHVYQGMICAAVPEGEKDSCQGDSGGPLVVAWAGYWTLAGATSFGRGCARVGYPGVYTEISHVVGWINREMNKT